MIPTDEQITETREIATAAMGPHPLLLKFTMLMHRTIIEAWEKVRPVPQLERTNQELAHLLQQVTRQRDALKAGAGEPSNLAYGIVAKLDKWRSKSVSCKGLTYPEAMQALLDGMNVRLKAWPIGRFIAIVDGRLYNEGGLIITTQVSCDAILGRWEVARRAPAVNLSARNECTVENCPLCAGAKHTFPEPSKDLTFPEAMQALIDGKKVRVDAWGEGEWIRRSNTRGFKDENGDGVDIIGSPDRIFGKWRIVEDAPAAEPIIKAKITKIGTAYVENGRKHLNGWTFDQSQSVSEVEFSPEGKFLTLCGYTFEELQKIARAHWSPAAEPEKTSGLTINEAMLAIMNDRRVRHESWRPDAYIGTASTGESDLSGASAAPSDGWSIIP